MHVRVFALAGRPQAEVMGVDDLTRLALELDGVDPAAAGTALQEQGLGEVDGEHAWLVIARLRLAGPADPAWTERFAAMIGYAASRNWLDGTGTRVRAHLETASGPAGG